MGKMRMFQLLLNQEMKKGQENDWKVSFTTWVVPTQEEEIQSTISKPPSTFRAVLTHVWKDRLSMLVSLPGVSAWDSEPSSPDESEEERGKMKGSRLVTGLKLSIFHIYVLLCIHYGTKWQRPLMPPPPSAPQWSKEAAHAINSFVASWCSMYCTPIAARCA